MIGGRGGGRADTPPLWYFENASGRGQRFRSNPSGVYLKSVVGPTAEFHIALLIVERKPRDVDLARTFEYTRRYEHTATVAVHHHVGCVRAVETFVGAETNDYVQRYPASDCRFDTTVTIIIIIIIVFIVCFDKDIETVPFS